MKPSAAIFLGLRFEDEGRVHSRNPILQLSNISKKITRMKVPFNICLFERHNLGTEEMLEIEDLFKLLAEVYPTTRPSSALLKPIRLQHGKKSYHLLSCTISKANNGLSVPEQTVTTRNGLSPKCARNPSRPRSIARSVMSL